METTKVTGARLIAIVCAAEIAGMAAYAGFAGQLPLLSREWNLSASQAGWIGGAFYGGYAIAVPILVTLTDRTGPRTIYLPSMLATSLGALGFSLLANGFWSALVFQALMGVGLAGTYMPGLRLLTDRLAGPVQSRAVALYTSSYAVGTGASFALIGLLSHALGWRWAFGLAAIGPAAAFLAVAALFRDEPISTRGSQPIAAELDFRPVLRDRAVLARSLAYAAHNFELFGLWSWAVAFLAFAYALRPGDPLQLEPTLIVAALTILLLPASVGGNEIAMRVGRRRWIVAVMVASAMLATVVGFTAGAMPSGLLVAILLVYGSAVAAESGALTSSVVAAADPRLRGTTMAVYSTLGFAGAFAGPLMFGWVLDLVGPDSVSGWGAAFAAMGVGALVGPVALLLLDSRRDGLPGPVASAPLTQRTGARE